MTDKKTEALASKPWISITANTILNLMPESIPAEHDGALLEFARAIEAKLKDLNTWATTPSSAQCCLYTSPPASKPFIWLTNAEIAELKILPGANRERTATEMAFAIEAKLRSKNGY